MDEAEMKHRSEHRDEKLQGVFPDVLPYYFSKISEAIDNPTYLPLGVMHVNSSPNVYTLKKLLEKRGEWGIYDSVN